MQTVMCNEIIEHTAAAMYAATGLCKQSNTQLQATKENELLKAQVTDEEHRRQQAIDLLLGAAVPQNGA